MLHHWSPSLLPFSSSIASLTFRHVSVATVTLVIILVSLFFSPAVNAGSYESAEMLEERGGKRMFYQPWPYMKRMPSTEPIIRFGKRPEELTSADLFEKRSNVVPFIRFGRRPVERAAPLIRFGKRAQIRMNDAAPLIRFGRSSEERK